MDQLPEFVHFDTNFKTLIAYKWSVIKSSNLLVFFKTWIVTKLFNRINTYGHSETRLAHHLVYKRGKSRICISAPKRREQQPFKSGVAKSPSHQALRRTLVFKEPPVTYEPPFGHSFFGDKSAIPSAEANYPT